MKWTSKHVAQWLEWSMQEFGLDAIDASKFQLTGSQLLSLSKEEFLERAPPFTGDVLYAHLKLLQARSGKHYMYHLKLNDFFFCSSYTRLTSNYHIIIGLVKFAAKVDHSLML